MNKNIYKTFDGIHEEHLSKVLVANKNHRVVASTFQPYLASNTKNKTHT